MRANVTYDDVRRVLRQLGFEHVRTGRHEIWRRASDGRFVPVKKQHAKRVPPGLFAAICREAGVTRKDFLALLRR